MVTLTSTPLPLYFLVFQQVAEQCGSAGHGEVALAAPHHRRLDPRSPILPQRHRRWKPHGGVRGQQPARVLRQGPRLGHE